MYPVFSHPFLILVLMKMIQNYIYNTLNPLLITGFGTSINVDKRKLIITNKLKGTKLEFFPHKINHDGIIIDGHTGNITFEAMR